MELKSEEGSLGYTSIFPDSSETLNPPPLAQLPKRLNTDHFNGGDNKTQPKSAASGGGGARFRECQKNHAASAGGKVLDGCGEFMPAGDDGTLEALKCAACSCHRNFHRKESAGGGVFSRRAMVLPLQLPPPPLSHRQANHWAPVVQPVKMTVIGGGGRGNGGTDSSSEDLNFNAAVGGGGGPPPPPPPFVMSKKRFRTRFTAEQKGKMMEYAEKVGWRIPREDDAEVQRFCGEIGVKRQVFKVWMHNNKNSTKKLGQNQEEEEES
ncbi:hypothetical protein RHSIM_Rhsim06G0032400 [Rhododendron simsii]|uniref:ZF-HD dimerization-type domain-containing protein n=1 Tax=Rhododendron simsii TaxID=118357 RepID=A0A834H2D6_RHOSS|nr:hypothetical protein RHSIM_Rhsim06G0032400 [Rhododendron simsii]